MDIQALLETIEEGLNKGANESITANADWGCGKVDPTITDAIKAFDTLRAYITAQQQLLEQAQTVASQQRVTLEKVEAERQAYREQAKVLANNYEGVFYNHRLAILHGMGKEFEKSVDAIHAIIDLIEKDTIP